MARDDLHLFKKYLTDSSYYIKCGLQDAKMLVRWAQSQGKYPTMKWPEVDVLNITCFCIAESSWSSEETYQGLGKTLVHYEDAVNWRVW
jgi:hypothetical protein